MKKINLGLIGFGNVGSGVIKLLTERKNFIKEKFHTDIVLKKICDKIIHKRDTRGLPQNILTKNFQDVTRDKDIDVIIELIGGMHPAEEIMREALKNGKHVITANKELLAHKGKELFHQAIRQGKNIYFETAVGAGTPLINMITDGLAGNKFHSVYGIINGTCNFILSEMTRNNLTFGEALLEAQKRGFAESNPRLDITGMDSAHKLAILAFLCFGKFVSLSDMHVEGISHISPADIEFAKSMNLTIKLLGIAKKTNDQLEVRVHPTLISEGHPLASVSGVYNAIFLDTNPQGKILLYGQGAGQFSAASGVVSDLLNLAARQDYKTIHRIMRMDKEAKSLKLRKIGNIHTRFYLRLMVIDKPGVLAKISGILGHYGVSIASMTQKGRNKASAVPIIMLTHHAQEQKIRLALEKITRLNIVKSKPVAIRMENLQ